MEIRPLARPEYARAPETYDAGLGAAEVEVDAGLPSVW